MFTQRHYEKIAEIMRECHPSNNHYDWSGDAWDRIVGELADMFEKDNEKFDREKFLKYSTPLG